MELFLILGIVHTVRFTQHGRLHKKSSKRVIITHNRLYEYGFIKE